MRQEVLCPPVCSPTHSLPAHPTQAIKGRMLRDSGSFGHSNSLLPASGLGLRSLLGVLLAFWVVERLFQGCGQGSPGWGLQGAGALPTPLLPVEPLLPQELLVNLRTCFRVLRGQSQGRGARPPGQHNSQESRVLPFLGWEEPKVGASMGNKR